MATVLMDNLMDNGGEVSDMAGIPKPHGNGWRVRWQYRYKTAQAPVDDYQQGMRLKAWLESQGDDVSPLDPRVTSGSWDVGYRATEDDSLTLGEWWDTFNEARDCRKLTKHRDDKFMRGHLGEWWDLPLRAFDRAMLNALIDKLRTTPKQRVYKTTNTTTYAPSTIHSVLRRLSGLFTAALKAGKIDVHPFAFDPERSAPQIKAKKAAGMTHHRMRSDDVLYLTPTEFGKLLAASRVIDPTGQMAILLALLIETGCRIGEALALRVKHCHLSPDAAFIRIEANRLPDGTDGPPKRDKNRSVALGPQSLTGLLKLAAGRSGDACVFRAPVRRDKGYRYNNWYERRWAPLIQEARENHGLDRSLSLYPHALRMNHATWAKDSKADPFTLARSMGHISLLTTEGYTLDSAKAREHMASVVATFLPAEEDSQ